MVRGNLSAGWDGGVPQKHNELVQHLFEPHIKSFDFAMEDGLERAVDDLDPVQLKHPVTGDTLTFWFERVEVGLPTKRDDSADARLFPGECREGGLTYRAPVTAVVVQKVNNSQTVAHSRRLGNIPIMTSSRRCHLNGLSPKELVKAGEEPSEQGGYFILNGIERIIRMLVIARRNYPLAISRPSFKKRGSSFSEHGVLVRCVRHDETNVNNVVHYLNDGTCCFAFSIIRQQFFVPVALVLRALRETTDREIFERLVCGDMANTFLTDRVELLLSESHRLFQGCHTRLDALAYLGSRFRVRLDLPEALPDDAVGRELLRRFVLPHLSNESDKFMFLIFMIQKLYGLVGGTVAADSADSPINQEILMPGHVYLMVLKQKLADWLTGVKRTILRDLQLNASQVHFNDQNMFLKCMDKGGVDVGRKLEYFLATGNLVGDGLGLQQSTGFTVVAEKLNYLRYLSHFRSVHRGQVFTEMKTTSVRRLLPEAWGFICPVHTPDGSPCGLLNHLSSVCRVVCQDIDTSALVALLASYGVVTDLNTLPTKSDLPVLVDGRVVGFIALSMAENLNQSIRRAKLSDDEAVDTMAEVCLLLPDYAGDKCHRSFHIFTGRSRLMRPVLDMRSGKVDWIGTMEQEGLNIACAKDEIIPGFSTHQELRATNILSVVANMTPFSDLNQSPRNMYQCQMGKQSMATPCHAYAHRTDNKMYRLQTPQLPICRTDTQEAFDMDDYPTGTNAVVAVISYTGYDMEDAMIINKSSFERGFGHGTVYTTTEIDLEQSGSRGGSSGTKSLHNIRSTDSQVDEGAHGHDRVVESLDRDGLPPVGHTLEHGDPFYCVLDETTGQHKVEKYKSMEPSVVEEVRVIHHSSGSQLRKASIKLRFNRNPVIGDKFSSRHGQKGTLSQLWPQEDMPFSESGMTPDVIINPHAFPSRMTIGMLVESMAAKSGSLQGRAENATTFRFNDNNRAIDYFGEQLRKAGYQYYGSERMYSGLTGTEMHADIFFGVVYYQRLRHMVKDKFQVRSTGPVHNLTRQPIKGRKKGGGIRFGEMERDSLLAHGASLLLHDRLFNCSDAHDSIVCASCGSLMGPLVKAQRGRGPRGLVGSCLSCGGERVVQIRIPYVFKYLVNELAGMGVKITLGGFSL